MKKFVIVLAAVLLSGCRTKYVEVERVHRDTLWHERMVRDSVYLHDSVFTVQWMDGETLRVETERWHDRWRERVVHDTARVVKVDSVAVPVLVEKELNRWQKFCVDWGKVTLGGSVAGVLLVVGGGVYYLRRRRG